MKSFKLFHVVIIAAITAVCGINGCTKAPSKDEQSQLEEAKTAAEAAVKKEHDTKEVRMRLEAEKGVKSDDSQSEDK